LQNSKQSVLIAVEGAPENREHKKPLTDLEAALSNYLLLQASSEQVKLGIETQISELETKLLRLQAIKR